MTSFVRIMMKHYISQKYTSGQSTLIVYLLEPEIEEMLSQPETLPAQIGKGTWVVDGDIDRISEAVWAESWSNSYVSTARRLGTNAPPSSGEVSCSAGVIYNMIPSRRRIHTALSLQVWSKISARCC